MKAEYVVVAEQAHPLGPAYSFPYYAQNYAGIIWKGLSRGTISLRLTFASRGFGTPGDMYGTLRVTCMHV